ncbi:MAG: hypothetical protein AW12_03122 [Candidatus Accumulibacter sp. BA-94]|nr:MAG: hypothetical protein AW12_03122 [Candidatus Accumulibacter sp. BA-94]
MRMLGNLHQIAVFLFQALIRGMAIVQNQLDRSRHVAQRVDYLVDHAEAALTKLPFDNIGPGQRITRR